MYNYLLAFQKKQKILILLYLKQNVKLEGVSRIYKS